MPCRPLMGLLFVWVLILGPWSQGHAAMKALVYNATGEELRLVINGRGHILTAAHPVMIAQSAGDEGLVLEMANFDGQLLRRELKPDEAHVILFRQSTGLFVLWSLEKLNQEMAHVLAQREGACKAVIFNATGQLVKGLFADKERRLNRATCLFFPTDEDCRNLIFKFTDPDLPPIGPLKNMSQHVLVYDAENGHAVVGFEKWAETLRTRLNGLQESAAPPSQSPPAKSSSPLEEKTLGH